MPGQHVRVWQVYLHVFQYLNLQKFDPQPHTFLHRSNLVFLENQITSCGDAARGALPYMGYIGMCCCEGYGFQAVYSRIGYINQSVWV